MFDLTSSKLLILAVIALIVVGPKDLPVLLRAIGKYVGIVRRQANEFRQYFDEAMRENELASLKAEVDAMKRDVQATVSSAGRALEADIDAVKTDIEAVKSDVAAVKLEAAAATSGDTSSLAPYGNGYSFATSNGPTTNGVTSELAVDTAVPVTPVRIPEPAPAKAGGV